MKVIIAAGKEFRLNDLSVVAVEELAIDLVTAANEDQAAGLCAAHGIPADMSQFVHQEDDVQVSYSHLGERVETRLETPEEKDESPAPAAPIEESGATEEEDELPNVPAVPVVGEAPQEPALPPISTPSEGSEGGESPESGEGSEGSEAEGGSEPASNGEPEAPSTEGASA